MVLKPDIGEAVAIGCEGALLERVEVTAWVDFGRLAFSQKLADIEEVLLRVGAFTPF